MDLEVSLDRSSLKFISILHKFSNIAEETNNFIWNKYNINFVEIVFNGVKKYTSKFSEI